jgi:pyrimidine-nucleoside phosphorylase
MQPASLIAVKRDGLELSDQQIDSFIGGVTSGAIPDYQATAMLMAIFLRGMSPRETASLTAAMLHSGTRLQWPPDGRPVVDKHSTGGLGDKTSLIIAPLLAECEVLVPMLSGRGLGPTGGTLDKLEAIPGFRTNLSIHELQQQVLQLGCVITGTTHELAPADRRLYALRDVTATVPSIPLITGSIMSKKLAESPHALVLDVKYGSGAFMKTAADAALLAASLVRTGHSMNVATTALLTDMNQPLGAMCGNAVEVLEAVMVMQNHGPLDVRRLSLLLAAHVLVDCKAENSHEAAFVRCEKLLQSGAVYERFLRMVQAQHGDYRLPLKIAPASELTAARSGFLHRIHTEQLGSAVIALGGGRQQTSDTIDHSVGIEMLVRIGDQIEAGQPLVRIYSRNPEVVHQQVLDAMELSDAPLQEHLPIIHSRLTINAGQIEQLAVPDLQVPR